jgi:hypothetical protein
VSSFSPLAASRIKNRRFCIREAASGKIQRDAHFTAAIA